MKHSTEAFAFSNIALIKYWGKADIEANIPATPSISISLDKLKTETSLEVIDGGNDIVLYNGQPVSESFTKRIIDFIDLFRKKYDHSFRLKINTFNSFPTKAGLASSASGFAALAIGLFDLAGMEISPKKLSRFARLGSGSAARSITGGLTIFPNNSKNPYAEQLYSPEQVPWVCLALIVDEESKKTGSRDGMSLSKKSSPYYKEWIIRCERHYKKFLDRIDSFNLKKLGPIIEANCLAMHGVMVSTNPPLYYWNDCTIDTINRLLSARDEGLEIYFTTDAGPNIFIFADQKKLAEVESFARRLPGVKQIIVNMPAGPAGISQCISSQSEFPVK